MYVKYLYYSTNGNATFNTLVGAKITIELENQIKSEEVYIGSHYTLAEFLQIKNH